MNRFQAKSLADSTPAEQRRFATVFLGLPIDDSMGDAEVLAKIRASHEGDTIFVEDIETVETDQTGSPPVDPDARRSALVGTLGHGDPKVTLVLHAEERDGVVVNRHKEVGVNGQTWLLKRGEPITIPYRVFEALQNAERHVITHTGDGEVREQKVKNTPYDVQSMPSAAEISEWHAKTDNLFVP